MENVLPHSRLQQLSPDLWILEGSLPHKVPLPRNMVIFRTSRGELWVHSPVAVEEETKQKIDALGIVTWIVVPNDMHRMDAPVWRDKYPSARIICPKAAFKKVSKKVSVTAVAEEEFQNGEVIAHPMAGATGDELSYELNLRVGKALVVNDLLVNVESLPGFMGRTMKLLGRIGRFRVPNPQSFLFIRRKQLFREWLRAMAKKDYLLITVSHGKPITNDIAGWFHRAAIKL